MKKKIDLAFQVEIDYTVEKEEDQGEEEILKNILSKLGQEQSSKNNVSLFKFLDRYDKKII